VRHEYQPDPMSNAEVAKMLYEIADLLELKDVPFKPVAYRRAARNIEALTKDIAEYQKAGRLTDIEGVGEAIAKKVDEIVRTGHLEYLDDLRKEVPAGLLEVLRIPDIGPKTAMRLYKELKIGNLQELKEATQQHRLHRLKGFGEKTEEQILQGIALAERRSGRMLLGYAYPTAQRVKRYVEETAKVKQIEIGGSLRRMKETIGDIDILVGTEDPERVLDVFTKNPEVADVVMRGPTKATVRLKEGTQVDMRVVAESQYGAALQYFTGGLDHNVALRSIAIDKGLKLNEYGVFRKDTNEVVAGRTEEEVYHILGMDLIPPEMRENRGEIKAAQEHRLPKLVELSDIKGDFHVHSSASDGSSKIEDIAYYCKNKGYEYVGLTDHSASLKVAGGLSVEELKNNVAIAKNVSKVTGLHIFTGAEVDILEDGSLDYPAEAMDLLDFTVCAVHSKFNMPRAQMTERILTALADEHLTILGHPTGRILDQREPYEVDIERVMDDAKAKGKILEVSALPDRLDLNDVNCRRAKERGVMVSVDTDAHGTSQLDFMLYGVAQARRGWIEAKEVLNAHSLKEVERILGL
jgi:DNA polymerase (family 10)